MNAVRMAVLMAAAAATIGAVTGCSGAPKGSVDEGKTLYRQNGCARCHGGDGQGDGPLASTLDPRPRDFRDVAAFKNGTDATTIAETIAAGIPEGGRMPQFAHLTESERQSLALFVISLRESKP